MKLRTKIIQLLITINEKIFFYPSLRKFYKMHIKKTRLNILDIGANKGQSIDFFMKLSKNITIDSFEPNKKLFNFLLKKYHNNTNIKLHNYGISNTNGELLFYENILDETSSFEELNFESSSVIKKANILGVSKKHIIVDSYMVKTIRLIDHLKMNPHVFYDIIKIDVEGHELNCLQRLFNNNNIKLPIKFIQLESHNDDIYLNNKNKENIKTILKENGFNEVANIRHAFGDFNELIYKNINYYEA